MSELKICTALWSKMPELVVEPQYC